MTEEQDVARLIGQAFWRSEFMKANPDATPDDIRAHLASDWREHRKDYTRTGLQVLRALARQGYGFSKDAAAPQEAAGTDDADSFPGTDEQAG